ncbi:DUF4097 family beta strand repeat-containing protein [Roseivirga misakiensis]|nr:DUF4097 domain-containing protein [Roseivirga misakiensis]
MKTIISALVIGAMAYPLSAQQIDVQVDVKSIEASVEEMAEIAVENVFESLGQVKVKNKGKAELQEQSTQEIDIPLSRPGERGFLDLATRNGRLKVTGYDGATVKVKVIKYGKKIDKNKTKNGLRLVSNGGFNFDASENNNRVKVDSDGWNTRVDFEVQVPRNFDLKLDTYNNGYIDVDGVNGEFDMESYNGPITMTNIGGAVSASTYNGSIKVAFNEVTPDTPMSFETYNGDVDISVPDGTKLSAKMKTNRDIYTDFESFTLSQPEPETNKSDSRGGFSIKFDNWVQGDLNGGGPSVTMKTRNGNVYIRKN